MQHFPGGCDMLGEPARLLSVHIGRNKAAPADLEPALFGPGDHTDNFGSMAEASSGARHSSQSGVGSFRAAGAKPAAFVDLTRGPYESEIASGMETKLTVVQIEKPEPINFILGQTHFIKSVEDIHEALINAVPGIKFGLAFCEASGKCLVRWTRHRPRDD